MKHTKPVFRIRTNPRRRFRIVLSILCACAAAAGLYVSNGLGKGRMKMQNISLTMKLHQTETVFWESIPFKAVITNHGQEPVVLPTGVEMPIGYEIRSQADNQVEAVVSARQRLEMLIRGRDAPPRKAHEDALGPGDTLEISGDIALYAMAGIPPGSYTVVARLETDSGRVSSPPETFVIKPTAIGQLATQWCRYTSTRATVFSHTDPQGGHWLFQQEAENQYMSTNVFYRHKKLQGDIPIGDLALAVGAEPETQGRWSAYLRGRSFNAVAWNRGIIGMPPQKTLELENPRFFHPGYQYAPTGDEISAVGDSLFWVTGTADHQVWVQQFRVSKEKITPGPRVPLSKAMPQRLAVCCSPSESDAYFDLIWSEVDGGVSRICVRSYTQGGETADPRPRILYERSSPLLALEVAPLSLAPPGNVHALFGPEKADSPAGPMNEGGRLVYAIISTAEPAHKAQEYLLTPPKARVDQWAITAYGEANLPVAALCQGRILYTTADAPMDWQVLVQETRNARQLQLAASTRNGDWYPLWIDSSGLQYKEMGP